VIAVGVYVLCTMTSALCAALLLREYRRRGARLLLWSGASFVGFAISNALVFADFVMLPDVDLSSLRAVTACASVAILLYGLVWDAD
jgi:hypothetical protein